MANGTGRGLDGPGFVTSGTPAPFDTPRNRHYP